MTATVLTRPNVSSSGVPGTIITGIPIPFALGTNIVTVDTIPTGSNISVKWLYTLMSAAQDKVLVAEIIAMHRIGVDVSFNRYSVTGDRGSLPHRTNVTISGTDVIFEITNLSNASTMLDYLVNVVRIQTLL